MSMALLACIVLLANIVETVLGFGSTLIAVALAAHLYPLDTLLPVLVPVNIVLSVYLLVRHRQHVRWRTLGRIMLPFALTGLAMGLAVFTVTGNAALRLGYGVFVVAVAANSLVTRPPGRPAVSQVPAPLSLPASGLYLLGSGFFQGLFASGGPLMVLYAARQFPDKKSFRSTLAVMWAVLAAGMVATYALTGRLSPASLGHSASLLPVLAVAVAIGEFLHDRVKEKVFRRVVLVLLLAAGISLIASGV